MEALIKSLLIELSKATDDVVKRNLRNSIYFAKKAVEQQKLLVKKAERKLKQKAKDEADAKKIALREAETKYKR